MSDETLGEQTSVEIIHDALLREWDQLRRWLQEDRRFLIWRQEIERATRAWKEFDPDNSNQRDGGRLLRGRDLAEADAWLGERGEELGQEEREFIEASRDWQAQEQQRWKDLYEEAERQRQIAFARQLAAQAELVSGQGAALLSQSILLAAEAMKRSPSLQADQILRRGLTLLPHPTVRLAHEKGVKAVAFGPDGKYLATASSDNTAQVWEIPTGCQVARMTHDDTVQDVAFSPDGKYLATGSADGAARVWEVATERTVSTMRHQGGSVSAIVFSPDGKYLSTGGTDRTARVWETITGREIARIMHKGGVFAVAFTSEGRLLITANTDRSVRAWLWRPEDLIDEACERLTRNLTEDEWKLYLGDEPYRKTCLNLP